MALNITKIVLSKINFKRLTGPFTIINEMLVKIASRLVTRLKFHPYSLFIFITRVMESLTSNSLNIQNIFLLFVPLEE